MENTGAKLATSGGSRSELFGEITERPDLRRRRSAIRNKDDIGGPTGAPLNGAEDVLDEIRNGTDEKPVRAAVGVDLPAAGGAIDVTEAVDDTLGSDL